VADSEEFAGWIGLTDHTSEANRHAFHWRQQAAKMRTNTPVKIIAVHAGSKPHEWTVDVQPMVNQVDGVGKPTDHGTVYGIPMMSGSGGNGAVVVKPKVGDMGLMAIGDRDHSAALASKGQANPGSRRTHDMADGVYLGGFNNINSTDHYIVADENGFSIKGSLTIDGDVKCTGEVVAKTSGVNIHLSSHIHPGTGAPVPGS
jgi:hypothetical protein